MSQITSLAVADQLFAQGKGLCMPFIATPSGSVTSQGSSWMNPNLAFNYLGSTIPTTLVGIPLPPGTNILRLRSLIASLSSAGAGSDLSIIYKLGTLNLAATGDQFTHDAGWTGPLTRTVNATASTPISGQVLIQMTTATSTTAPIFRMRTVAGAAGYTNNTGGTTIGVLTRTFIGAVTSGATCVFMPLEPSDGAVRDVNAIEVTTASATGAANVWLRESIALAGNDMSNSTAQDDHTVGGLSMNELRPAAPTTGTVPTFLVLTNYTNGAAQNSAWMVGTVDT